MDNQYDTSLFIEIDNIRFTLLLMTRLNENYQKLIKIKVNVLNEPRETKIYPDFWIYQSNSELGLWRLCIFSDPRRTRVVEGIFSPFGKGVDYVQSTLVHLELQTFINKNIHNIRFEGFDPEKHKCICSERFNGCDQPIPDDFDDEVPLIDMIINDDDIRPIYEEPFKSINDEITCGIVNPKKNINAILKHFSINFKEQYNIVNITLVDNNNFIFMNIIKSNGYIYSIELERKIYLPDSKTNRILLYVMITQLKTHNISESEYSENITNICGKKFHIFPFLLTPLDSKINFYGIYDHYIPCGVFICKLFDYTYQCSEEEGSLYKCSHSYSYIGNRYYNLFPLQELVEHLQSTCSIKSKSSKKKSRKRRKTYKFHNKKFFIKTRGRSKTRRRKN